MSVETVAGIQARMGSTRFPGKVLADLNGRPMIERVFERTRAASLVNQVFVLTSSDVSDDPLVRHLERRGIPYRRGSLADVRSRYVALMDELDPRFVVRVCGDCPFVEPEFIDLQLGALRAFDVDLVGVAGNGDGAIEGTLGGQPAFSARALRRSLESEDRRDVEHVSSFHFRTCAERYRWTEIEVDPVYERKGLRLAVDEESDLEFARRVYAGVDPLGDGLFPLAKALNWIAGYPDVAENKHVIESADNRALKGMRRGETA